MLNFKNVIDQEHEAVVMTVFNSAASVFGLQQTNRAFSKYRNRSRNQVFIRAAVFYFLQNKYGVPNNVLARVFGFNHSTIIHAVAHFQDLVSVGDKFVLETYYKPMSKKISGVNMPPEELEIKMKALVRRWTKVNLLYLLEEYTTKMESKVYNIDKLINDVETMGYRIIRNPETVFVSYKIEEEQLPEEIKILRNTYGFMVQTEIE
jgi:hypothetical protein